MAAKRSLLQIIFGNVRDRWRSLYGRSQIISGYTPVFVPWSGRPYEADVVRSAVDAIARNAAKLKPRHIRRVGKEITPVGGQIEKVLQVRPNQNMNAYDFLYKVITTLLLDNNVFIYPVWQGATLTAVWPINCAQAEFLEDDSKTIYVRFYFSMGEQVVLPYSEVLHLRRHYYRSDLLGENNKALDSTLDAIHTSNQGISQAIKTSANLRGILKYQGMLKPEDIQANRERFVKEFMVVSNSGGVAALDSKADYIELKNEPKIVNAAQMKELRDNVYRYFGVNENIVKGDYTEEQWNAFYESTIEPLAVQMSLEFTGKMFTERERGRGNEIIFEANRLQYASVTTKLDLREMVDRGALTPNEWREAFNLAPVEGGDKPIRRLDTRPTDDDGNGEGDGADGNSQEGNSAGGTSGT